MNPNSTFCQRALHTLHLVSLMAWWGRRNRSPEGTCPLQFSHRARQRVAWARFVCGIGSPADVLSGKHRQP